MTANQSVHPIVGSLTGDEETVRDLVAEARHERASAIIDVRALSSRVLAVACATWDDRWTAFIDAVPGQLHEREAYAVETSGVRLPEVIARAIFPQFDDRAYKRP